jgi:hypothetical protein
MQATTMMAATVGFTSAYINAISTMRLMKNIATRKISIALCSLLPRMTSVPKSAQNECGDDVISNRVTRITSSPTLAIHFLVSSLCVFFECRMAHTFIYFLTSKYHFELGE